MVSDEDDYLPSEGVESRATASTSGGFDDELGQHARDTNDADEEIGSMASSLLHSPTAESYRKRRLPPDYAGAPLKRHRQTFNTGYLELLNQDIADAAAQIVVETDDRLKHSQIGAALWTIPEKEAFFSALGRLGRDDLPGIAARIGTKSPLEVRQYIILLSERERVRRAEGELRRKTLKLVEIPAAMEVGPECCFALDEVADDLSLRQESYEVGLERKRWGDHWLIDHSMVEKLESRPQPEMQFTDFFVLRNWLKLSERVFMNSVIPDYNWVYVSEQAPSIQTTAFSDFHSLVVSVTKRLVASTLFMSGMRIKEQQAQRLVKRRDVLAAVEALRMKPDSKVFWTKAPRRLRLDILRDEAYLEEGHEVEESGDDVDCMSYEDVEATLGSYQHRTRYAAAEDHGHLDTDNDEHEDVASLDESSEEDENLQTDGLEVEPTEAVLDEGAIGLDMQEAMLFSADYEGTTRARQALVRRIEAEHRMEAEAEDHDGQTSKKEEARLWTLLRHSDISPSEAQETKSEKSWRGGRAAYEPTNVNWRDKLRFVSAWENSQ
ncbi:hypothetical protein BX600DRAFT_505119 [Xylariales sp. PMI_506]|nr:hypothetical protein BX600DRAFT_505119 [Xylariales sp. PMI_506]